MESRFRGNTKSFSIGSPAAALLTSIKALLEARVGIEGVSRVEGMQLVENTIG
jgi:hypothetical protein